MVFEHEGDTRVYPFQILMFHELVNDRIGDLPFLVSYCPLCNSAIVFDRRVDGEVYSFGVSGMLRHSDMVMYDRQTDSLWQQLTGEALVGELTGKQLEILPSHVFDFGTVRSGRPDAKVLSRRTGVIRPYGPSPYVGYEFGRGGASAPDGELRGKDRLVVVYGEDGEVKAYPLDHVRRSGAVQDSIGDLDFVIVFDPRAQTAMDAKMIRDSREVGTVGVYRAVLDGEKLKFRSKKGSTTDRRTKSEWNVLGEAISGPLAGKRLEPVRHGVFYAFAWLAFHPETKVKGIAPRLGTDPFQGPSPSAGGRPGPGAPGPGTGSFP